MSEWVRDPRRPVHASNKAKPSISFTVGGRAIAKGHLDEPRHSIVDVMDLFIFEGVHLAPGSFELLPEVLLPDDAECLRFYLWRGQFHGVKQLAGCLAVNGAVP